MPGSVVTVQLGQCGNQVRAASQPPPRLHATPPPDPAA